MDSVEANTDQNIQFQFFSQRTKTIFLSSFAVVLVFLFFSPNFQTQELVRDSPLGSDFLQEWTGGFIWRSDSRARLYSESHYSKIQHESEIVGFDWPESKFYPMVYPPFYYMVLSPLSYLPYELATKLWIGLLGLSTFATLWIWTTYYPPANQHWGKCTFALLAFFPFLMSFNTAHKSILLLLILSSTFLLLYHKRPTLSGVVFGLIAFKPHLGLLIGISMLLKRQWRFVLGCSLSVFALVGLSMLAGTDLCVSYFHQMTSSGNYASNAGYQLAEAHNLIGALSLTFGPKSWLTAAALAVAISALIWMLFKTMRGGLDATSPRFAFQFSVLVLATILSSPTFLHLRFNNHAFTYRADLFQLRCDPKQRYSWSATQVLCGVLCCRRNICKDSRVNFGPTNNLYRIRNRLFAGVRGFGFA